MRGGRALSPRSTDARALGAARACSQSARSVFSRIAIALPYMRETSSIFCAATSRRCSCSTICGARLCSASEGCRPSRMWSGGAVRTGIDPARSWWGGCYHAMECRARGEGARHPPLLRGCEISACRACAPDALALGDRVGVGARAARRLTALSATSRATVYATAGSEVNSDPTVTTRSRRLPPLELMEERRPSAKLPAAAATPTSASALPAGGAPPLAMSKSPPVTKRELSELKHRSSDSEFDKRRGGRQNSDDDSEASGDIKLPRMSLDEKWSPPNRNSPRAGAAFLCRGASFLAIHLTRIPLCPPPRQNLLTCVTPRPRRRSRRRRPRGPASRKPKSHQQAKRPRHRRRLKSSPGRNCGSRFLRCTAPQRRALSFVGSSRDSGRARARSYLSRRSTTA